MRSDTVTTPTARMRAAMAAAEVGDAVYGEDPTERELEERVAELFGKEGAVFVPTCTQSNLISVMANTWTRGAEYIVGDHSHIYTYEQGGGAQFASAHPMVVRTQADGTLSLPDIEAAMRDDDPHYPVTQLVCLENTHNGAGGLCLPTSYVREVAELAHKNNAALHIDGARIWHAATALNESLAAIAAPADTLAVCLSKGLGAPAGSLVVGDKAFVAKARRLRKGLGGAMRQTGVLAATGLVALDEILPRLGEDHVRAARLAAGLSSLGFSVQSAPTNLVYFAVPAGVDAAAVIAEAETRGVRLLLYTAHVIRAVTHHQVDDEGVERALAVLGEVMEGCRARMAA